MGNSTRRFGLHCLLPSGDDDDDGDDGDDGDGDGDGDDDGDDGEDGGGGSMSSFYNIWLVVAYAI